MLRSASAPKQEPASVVDCFSHLSAYFEGSGMYSSRGFFDDLELLVRSVSSRPGEWQQVLVLVAAVTCKVYCAKLGLTF